jgi:hypothetical protein
MTRPIKHGQTDQRTRLRFVGSTDGLGATGLTAASTGLSLYYQRLGSTPVAISPVASTGLDAAHGDGKFLPIADGYYQLDAPDAAFLSGADSVLFTGSAPSAECIGSVHPLVSRTSTDNYAELSSTTYGLAKLKTAADAADNSTSFVPVAKTTGLDALESHGDANWATAATSGLATSTDTDAINTRLDSTTYGLAKIKTAADAADNSTEFGPVAKTTGLDALEAHGDATWATAATSALATSTDTDAIITRLDSTSFGLDALREDIAGVESASVCVYPLSVTHPAGQASTGHLVAYQYHSIPDWSWTVTDSSTDASPVDLSGKTVKFIAYDPHEPGTAAWSLSSTASELTIGGTGNNVVTAAAGSSNTQSAGWFNFRLANVTDKDILQAGTLDVQPGPPST